MDIELRVVIRRSHDTRSSHVNVLQQRRKNVRSDASYVGGPVNLRWSDWLDIPIVYEEDLK